MKLKHAQDAYLQLLRIPHNEIGRIHAQAALCVLRDEIAAQEHRDSESVQNQYERMAVVSKAQ